MIYYDTRLSVLSFLQPRAKSTEGGDEIFQMNVSAVLISKSRTDKMQTLFLIQVGFTNHVITDDKVIKI